MRDEDNSLRDTLVESYVLQGTPPEAAAAFVDKAFDVHEAIETYRSDIVIANLEGIPKGIGPNFMLLIVQLEMMHLNGVLRALADQLGVPLQPTVQ